jgi:hypothetical protein
MKGGIEKVLKSNEKEEQKMRKVVMLLSALFLVTLFSIPVFGQSTTMSLGEKESTLAGPEIRQTYGITDPTSYEVSMFDCNVSQQSNTWAAVMGTPNRYLTAPGNFECPVHLPAGASIVSIELEACDTSGTGQATADFDYAPAAGISGGVIDSVSTGASFSAGCAFFSKALGTPVTIDNYNNKYWFEISNDVYDGSVYIAAARVYYVLQVSPAPDTATFGDVPTTHPFFQYIEALYSAGITAGCGGGDYCPDDPLTRGQMAVFLSRALGLHWPY